MSAVSPASLQNLCLDYVALSMCTLTECCCGATSERIPPTCALYRYLHFTDHFYLHSNLADALLTRIADKKMLCCETLSAFTPKSTCLRRVKIKSPQSSPYHRELHVLNQHQIVDFSYEEAVSVFKLQRAVVNKLIGCLNKWSRANLRSLNVSGCTFLEPAGAAVVISLTSLRELRTLNVSRTEFNDNMLKIVISELPKLESIDISATLVSDISPLSKISCRLRYLSMYNARVNGNNATEVLRTLVELRHLDISSDCMSQTFVTNVKENFNVNHITSSAVELRNLVSLDISGIQDVDIDQLCKFIESHTSLQFIGMCTTSVSDNILLAELIVKYRSKIQFSGVATVDQLKQSLSRYVDRQPYMRTCLYELFTHSESIPEPRVDLIKLVLPVMQSHFREVSVQMAGTACLYNLCRGELAKSIHICLLAEIVSHVLQVMTNSLHHQQLMKNCLLVLCHDRILQDVIHHLDLLGAQLYVNNFHFTHFAQLPFNRYRCATLVFDCLLKHDEPTMCRLAVAICGILGSKIPTSQSAMLGGCRQYMRKLLSIIESRIANRSVDVTLKFTLSTLWNLSDEAPATCEAFIAESGMEVYVNLLETFRSESEATLASIEVKMLGFLNNMAEVEHLKHNLLQDSVLTMVRELLKSKHQDVSYFSGGIFAHLLSNCQLEQTELREDLRQELLQELEVAVAGWKQPEQEMVAYRSFVPFFKLLAIHNDAPIQMWALWAWRHVCSRNGTRYCSMLLREGGVNVLLTLINQPNLSSERPLVAALAAEVMQIVTSVSGKGDAVDGASRDF